MIPETARALQEFTDDLSNWYVRRCRERFWQKELNQDKINAYLTLYKCLVTVSLLAAPMVPFITEEIYQNLVAGIDPTAPESVHLCDFPKADPALLDQPLEDRMDEVLKIVVMGRACRNTANIKNRQPIGDMYVKAPIALEDYFAAIIRDELNVKRITFTSDARAFTSYSFKPQMRTLGPKYGKYLNEIRQKLSELDGNAAMDELNETGTLKLQLSDITAELTKDDLLISSAQIPGFVSETNGEYIVVLDSNLTPELLEEGMVREIVSKIQTMRKEAGFEVMDHIALSATGNSKVEEILLHNLDFIKEEVLCDVFEEPKEGAYTKDWNLNGEDVTLAVRKL